MKPADAGVEVDEPQGHAADARDRQAEPAAGVADEGLLGAVVVERVGEDVDRVEAEFLRLLEAEPRALARLGECRVDESQPHAAPPHVAPQ
jgi:hypothetical protein